MVDLEFSLLKTLKIYSHIATIFPQWPRGRYVMANAQVSRDDGKFQMLVKLGEDAIDFDSL